MTSMTSGWQLRTLQGPEIEPLTLEEARKQCRIDPDITDEDDLIQKWIIAARRQCEQYTKRSFIERTLELALHDFPRDCSPIMGYGATIELPQGPVIAVLGVSYLQNDGTRAAVTEWTESLADEPATIQAPLGSFWPTGRCGPGSVLITYRAGYPGAGSPPDASGVPEEVKQCMRAIVSRYYEKRDTTNVDDILESIHHLRIYP